MRRCLHVLVALLIVQTAIFAAPSVALTDLEEIKVYPNATRETLQDGEFIWTPFSEREFGMFLKTQTERLFGSTSHPRVVAEYYEDYFGVTVVTQSRPVDPLGLAPGESTPIQVGWIQEEIGRVFHWQVKEANGEISAYTVVTRDPDLRVMGNQDAQTFFYMVCQTYSPESPLSVPTQTELGLPLYPGATYVPLESGDFFGLFSIHVFTAPAPLETVKTYYTGALGRIAIPYTNPQGEPGYTIIGLEPSNLYMTWSAETGRTKITYHIPIIR